MPNENDTLIDKDGVVHEKGWDGQYRPKQGLFGPEKDVKWTGQPKVENDWLGRPQEDRNWLGKSTQSNSGETLYRRSESSSSNSSSTTGGEGLLILVLVVAVLSIGLIGVVIVATPIIAPILLASAESARKRGDIVEFKKWDDWGKAASVIGVLVALLIAVTIGIASFRIILLLPQYTRVSVIVDITPVLAIICGFLAMAMSSVIGISPTAIVYLHNREALLRASGNVAKAVRVRKLNWVINIAAFLTLLLVLVIGFVLIIIGITTSLITG